MTFAWPTGVRCAVALSFDRRNWLNAVALVYVFIGYAAGLLCLTSQLWYLNAIGVLLTVHTLTWAAYFVHEFIHATIFRQHKLNVWFGQAMLFLTGSCYCHFRDLARNHLAHHKNRADFSSFSIAKVLNALPKPVRGAIVALEWLYFPAVNLILRWICIVAPFLSEQRKDERLRNALLLLLRGSLFVALAWYSLRAVVLYAIAYICFINILRFLDCFQHTYTVFQLGNILPQYSLEYEEANTFSNLVSYRYSWLNLLFLNFGYHNAHHRVTYCPWYLLPDLDAELYEPNYRQHVTLAELAGNYHRYRVHRLFHGQGTVEEGNRGLKLDNFVGGVGVSFLILREPQDWLKL